MPALLAIVLLQAAPVEVVKPKWRTPYNLYLTPREAYQKKLAAGDALLFIDVRTRAEIKFIGMANMVDANIPLRMLRDDYAWSEKSATYRTRKNPDFVAAVERLLEHRGLDRNSPIILMCQSGSRVPVAAQGFKAKQGPNKGQRVVNGWKNANLPWSYELDASKMYFNFAP
jgi:rhodanese-related sulfurtransferase